MDLGLGAGTRFATNHFLQSRFVDAHGPRGTAKEDEGKEGSGEHDDGVDEEEQDETHGTRFSNPRRETFSHEEAEQHHPEVGDGAADVDQEEP